MRCRGIRKINSKLRYNIDNFYYSEIEFVQGKNYKTLTDASIINKPQLTLSKLEFLNNIAELLDSFIKGEQRDDKIFDLLSKTFENLLKIKSYKLRNFYNYFFWNFISELGHMPETKKCAKCYSTLSPYHLYFSNKNGGIICRYCFNCEKDAKKTNSDIVKTLRLFLDGEYEVINKLKINPRSENLLNQITDNYYKYMKLVYN